MKSLKLTLKLLVYPLVTLASITASGLALADDPSIDNLVTTSLRSRAEVITEYYQARANGGMKVWSTSYNPVAVTKSLKTREEVKAEVALLAIPVPMAAEEGRPQVQRRVPARPDASRVLAVAGTTPR